MSKALATDLVKVAKAEVGYLEKRSNAQLESKTANAGSANFTKYGNWLGANGDYWCASFVSWCFCQAFGRERGKELLGTYSASCETIRQGFKAAKRYDSTPTVGAVVFFSGSRHAGANHVGIVVDVDSNHVKTVEGNTSGGSAVVDNGGGVAAKTYQRGYTRILGYGKPRYDTTESEGFDMASLPTIKYASTGAHVKTLQAVLKAKYGRELTVDGDFGNNTTKQLKAVQKQCGLAQDGVCGAKTWKAVL